MARINIGMEPLYFENKTQKLDPVRDMIEIDSYILDYIDKNAPMMKDYFYKDPFKFLIVMKILSCTDQFHRIKIFEELNNGKEFNVLVRKILFEIPESRVKLILDMISNRLIDQWNYFNNLWFVDDQQTCYDFPFYFRIEYFNKINSLSKNIVMGSKSKMVSSFSLDTDDKLNNYLSYFIL